MKKNKKRGTFSRRFSAGDQESSRNDGLDLLRKKFPPIDFLIVGARMYQGRFFHLEEFLVHFKERVLGDPFWKRDEFHRKGILSEFFVFIVLEKMKQEGTIRDFFQTKRNGRLDKMMVDFEIIVVDKVYHFIPLQVKSSRFYQEKHLREESGVPSVVSSYSFEELETKIKKIIESYIEGNILNI